VFLRCPPPAASCSLASTRAAVQSPMAAVRPRMVSCTSRMSLLSSSVVPFRPALYRRRAAPSLALRAPQAPATEQKQQQAEQHPQQVVQQRQHVGTQAAWLAATAAALACGPAAASGLPGIDASTAHSLEGVLRPLFAVFTLLYIIRIPMTWCDPDTHRRAAVSPMLCSHAEIPRPMPASSHAAQLHAIHPSMVCTPCPGRCNPQVPLYRRH
jgi:hypothetical protein